MGICRYCHQKTGWFTDAHDVCVEKASAGIESVKKCMADAVIEGKHYSDVSATIDKLAADAAIPRDQVHTAIKDGWCKGAETRCTAQPISWSDFDTIKKLQQGAGVKEEELYKTPKTMSTSASTELNKVRGKSRQAQIFTTWLHFGSNEEDKIRPVFRAMSCRINR